MVIGEKLSFKFLLNIIGLGSGFIPSYTELYMYYEFGSNTLLLLCIKIQ